MTLSRRVSRPELLRYGGEGRWGTGQQGFGLLKPEMLWDGTQLILHIKLLLRPLVPA